jgi:hypothetical protein
LEKLVLDGLKSLQKTEKIPLGKIASRLLADALSQRKTAKALNQPVWHWISSPMKSKVNLADKDAVALAMEKKK